MRIGVDARLLERKMTGIGRFLTCTLDSIPELDKENEYFLFSLSGLKEYENKGFKNIATGKNKLVPGFFYSPFWLNFVLPKYLEEHRIDAFFSPTGFLPLGKKKYKTLATVCDVFHKVNEKFHPFIYRKYADLFLTPSVEQSNMVLTISEASKKDILKFYRIEESRIKVDHLAADKIFHPRQLSQEEKERLRKKYGLPERFILYVGVLEERKNVRAMIEVADLLKGKTDAPILLFGKPGHNSKNIWKKLPKGKNIQYKGFVEKDDLPLIYNLASVFFFPTYYEGFGLPVLEAMQSGLPVVASNTSSLPEIVEEAGILCQPDDRDGFAKGILKLLQDKDFYDNMAEKGLERAKFFSWEKTVKIIINLLKSL